MARAITDAQHQQKIEQAVAEQARKQSALNAILDDMEQAKARRQEQQQASERLDRKIERERELVGIARTTCLWLLLLLLLLLLLRSAFYCC